MRLFWFACHVKLPSPDVMLVWSRTVCEFWTATFWCTRQSRKAPKKRSLFWTSGPPAVKLTSETNAEVLLPGRNPYFCSVGSVSLRPCRLSLRNVNVVAPFHLLPPVFVIMFRKTPDVGTVMSCDPVDTW